MAKNYRTKNSKHGFNLVELAIIITIIAIIITSISASRSIIYNSKLTNVIKNFNYYMSAMHSFNLEYSALPGDISNAYNFFGTDCDSVASYCNGNGDGLISTSSDSNDDETNRFWQHLYLAGYLNDYSSGMGGKASSSPKGPIDSSSFTMQSYSFYGYTASNNLTFSYLFDFNGILTPKDAKNIDSKMDDGLAGTGNILAADGAQYSNGVCTGSYYSETAQDYILTSTITGCLLAYPYEFQEQ